MKTLILRVFTTKSTSSFFCIKQKTSAESPFLRQDSTRAWLVLLSAFVASAFTLGNALTLGVMFSPIHALFPDAHASQINMIFALTAALTYMTGTLASTITSTIGYRVSMLAGALLACVGFICASFVTHLWHLYVTIGCTTGIGFGLIFTPAIGVIPFYFTRYRRFAVTTATMGVGVGVIFYSRFHSFVLETFGWRYAMQFEAALSLALFFCGIVVRDPPPEISLARRKKLCLQRNKEGSSENLTTTTQTIATFQSVESNDTTSPSENSTQTTVVAAFSAENKSAASETNEKAGGFHLFCLPKFYFILLQGLTLMCSSLFLITTTPFLTKTQHWTATHAASALTLFGIAALTMRISICLFNAFAAHWAKRLHAAVPIAAGNFMILAAACVYFFTVHKQQDVHTSLDGFINQTVDTSVNISSSSIPERNLFSEHNSYLLLAFAAINGAGHAIFLAYQTALIVDMLGAANLTAGFGYLNFVWGVAALLLYPAAGWVSDALGGMRYEYLLGIACGVFSLTALVVASFLHRRDTPFSMHNEKLMDSLVS